MSVEQPPFAKTGSRREGAAIAHSVGVVMGVVQKLDQRHQFIHEYRIENDAVSEEIIRFKDAVNAVKDDFSAEINALESHEHAAEMVPILDMHRLMLSDPELLRQTEQFIVHEQINAEWAIKKYLQNIINVFEQMTDPYLRERKSDVEHVRQRLFDKLLGLGLVQQHKQSIMVAKDFSPSDVVNMWRAGVAGFVSMQGGENSHAMIVARGVGLPGLSGVQDLFEVVEDGFTMILDAEQATWILHPSANDISALQRTQKLLDEEANLLSDFTHNPSISADGYAMPLLANIEFVEEVESVHKYGADGVGLFRTEFLFMHAETLPSEDKQLQYYTQMIKRLEKKDMTFRLLDIAADKVAGEYATQDAFQGKNPALGLRGVRMLLAYPDMLKTQLRAIVRVAHLTKVSILVPMVSNVEEMLAIRKALGEVCAELKVRETIALGCMIEVPAAAFMANELAEVSDFFSIGSNDLVQYSLAVDRTDDDVSYLYDVNHPAIMSLIQMIVSAAKKHHIPVSICGELAANPDWLQTFLNMKITSLSMSARHILPIRKKLLQLSSLS